MEKKVYEIFGKVLITNKPKVSFNKMNEQALTRGLFVPEELCYKWLYDYLRASALNPNATFYQSWKDIASKTRLELFLDQLRHYSSTYGTDFQGEAWIPERTQELPNFPYSQLKVVKGITYDELIEEVIKLAYSNIAVKEDTIDFLYNFRKHLDIDEVGIRQLKLKLIDENYKFKDGQECLLWILYKYFNITMLVKNKETLESLRPCPAMKKVLENNKEVLASVFFRNKDVFLTFKKEKTLRHTINRIRKLANKYHKPMKRSPWLSLESLSRRERQELFDKAPIFKLVQIYNALNNPTGYYVIRNGKAFYKKDVQQRINNLEILEHLLSAIISKVPKDVKSVSLPKGIDLAMPTSEKNFIGDIPIGSTIECSEKNTMVGIYWKNEWGVHDLDLHCQTIDGTSIGWNSDYYTNNKDIIFSGDMTDANPEASEVMWFKKEPDDSIVSVLEYNGQDSYEYDMFIAQESTTNFKKGYMVDPRNIIYQTRMKFENKSDVTLGYFKDGKFIFHSCAIGNGRVPGIWRTLILQHLVCCNYLKLRDVLELAGIGISDDSEIKLNSKGELINFFSL